MPAHIYRATMMLYARNRQGSKRFYALGLWNWACKRFGKAGPAIFMGWKGYGVIRALGSVRGAGGEHKFLVIRRKLKAYDRDYKPTGKRPWKARRPGSPRSLKRGLSAAGAIRTSRVTHSVLMRRLLKKVGLSTDGIKSIEIHVYYK